MAKYMLIMRPQSFEPGAWDDLDFNDFLAAIGTFNDELIRAGVLLAAEGLDPTDSTVVDFTGDEAVVTDGAYGEVKELFMGYYVIEVASKAEAVEWAKRMPLTSGTKVEIRRVTTVDEFPQDNEWVQKEMAWRESTGQR